MLTTPEEFFIETSQLLNEGTTDTSAKMVGYFNRAIRRIRKVRAWEWDKRKHDLILSDGVQEYDLTSAITDYNPLWGIIEVYIGGEKAASCLYEKKDEVSGVAFYLTPDCKTIGFTADIDGTEDIDIWYRPRHIKVTAHNSTLTVALPDDLIDTVALLMKAFKHNGKRQRADYRNTMIDYKEEIEELIMQDAAPKIKDAPQTVTPVLGYYRVKRKYTY